MNVFQNLIELYNHLSPDSTYKEVAGGTLKNLREAADASIYELAELTNSSRTTIYRMMQMLGYENYVDFRRALKQAVENYPYYNRLLDSEVKGIAPSVSERILSQLAEVTESVKQYLSDDEIREMAEIVSKKRQVLFFLPYQSDAVYSFQQNLSMAGIETASFCLFPEMLKSAGKADEGTLVFVMAIEHAETMNLTPVFRTLSEKGAEVAFLLPEKTRYRDYIDYPLCGERSGTGVLAGLLFSDMYLYALSETFRENYLKSF